MSASIFRRPRVLDRTFLLCNLVRNGQVQAQRRAQNPKYPHPQRYHGAISSISTSASTQRAVPLEQTAHTQLPTVTFRDPSGAFYQYEVGDGQSILDIAKAKGLEIEGACQGECACSTCHVIVSSEKEYQKLEPPSDQENDMLDLAFGLTETSRLGCQLKVTSQMDGLEIKLPGVVQDARA